MSSAHSHTHENPYSHDHVCWGGGSAHQHDHRLDVESLSVRYREVLALENVTFHSECGRSIALIGPNGAGKSTLLKALAGLIPISKGQVRWKGQRMEKSSHEIAYLPQRGDVDWQFPITVRGLVEMGRYPNLGLWKRYSEHDEEIVERALRAMELMDLQKRQISALSGGQQQRTFIARALAQEAHVLLLDEPFTGLDKPSQETLHRLFRDLTREGRLLIASHHNLQTVPEIFDDVLLLKRSQIAFGAISDVFSADNIATAYQA